ncbi:MAG: (d)CMP kinase [Coriobacteriales bacterium]|jgi:cytidylate kinase|nr:(d)CMP kinase [Coriobacteriales bacterium]
MSVVIAIDGPAGSGKSTVAKAVARELGFSYLDTGAMYRAATWLALEHNIIIYNAEGTYDSGDIEGKDDAIARLVREYPTSFGYIEGDPLPQSVCADGTDITLKIRTPRIDALVSPVSACPKVREALVEQQRVFAADHDLVAEGRDIGTVVFPKATLKVFLTATAEERARRRTAQNIEVTSSMPKLTEEFLSALDEKKVLDDIKRRDAYDSGRSVAPLVAADDAITVDTTDMTIEDVTSKIVWLARAA